MYLFSLLCFRRYVQNSARRLARKVRVRQTTKHERQGILNPASLRSTKDGMVGTVDQGFTTNDWGVCAKLGSAVGSSDS